MIPVIAAALCLYAARSDKPAQKRTVSTKPAPPQSAAAPTPPEAVQPIVAAAPKQRPTTDQYQQLVTPDIFAQPQPSSREYQLAQSFMGPYLSQAHVEHTQAFDSRIFEEGERVQSFQRRYDSPAGNRLWQICAIDSPYGHIYLSLMLNDDNSIPVDTAGVLVTYDNDGTELHIAQTESKQFERFGKRVFNYDKVLTTESQLRLFLGDRWHPHPVSYYFHHP